MRLGSLGDTVDRVGSRLLWRFERSQLKFLVDYKVQQGPILAEDRKEGVPLEQDVLLKLLFAVFDLNVV